MIPEKLKDKKNIIKIVSVVIAVVIIINIVISIVVTESFFNRAKFEERVKEQNYPLTHTADESTLQWFNIKSQTTEIETDSDTISAFVLENAGTSHSYAVLFHSLVSCPQDLSPQAYHFFDLGFNVYVPEYISDSVTMGLEEKEVIADVVNYIVEKDKEAKIFVYGEGIGGTSALLYAGGELPENVKGIIADSCYSDVKEVFKINVEELYNVSSFPTVAFADLYTRATRGWGFSDIDVFNAVRESQVPVLYIHATEDEVVPVNQSNELFEVTYAKGTEHITIYGADHCGNLSTDAEKYWRETDDFIRNSLD